MHKQSQELNSSPQNSLESRLSWELFPLGMGFSSSQAKEERIDGDSQTEGRISPGHRFPSAYLWFQPLAFSILFLIKCFSPYIVLYPKYT